MTTMVWHGHSWELAVPGPTTARHLAAMGKAKGTDAAPPMLDMLTTLLGPGQMQTLEDGVQDGQFPSNAFADLLTESVHHLSGRPLRAACALAGAAVSQWSIIRGRLVRDGIADPLHDLPTLWSLLDAVEAMVLESKQDEKETAEYWRSVYGADKGWDDDTEAAASDAFFSAFG